MLGSNDCIEVKHVLKFLFFHYKTFLFLHSSYSKTQYFGITSDRMF